MATAFKTSFSRLTNAFIGTQKSLNCGFFEIHPATAAEILAHRNVQNRKVALSKLAQTCDDIREGRFLINGESVIFSDTGYLLDGQHRLSGCVETNIPIITLVAFGISEEARRTIDTGKGRTVGDIAQLGGIADGNNITTIARLMIAYQRGGGEQLTRTTDISAGEILDFIEMTPEIHDLNKWAAHYQTGLVSVMPRTILAAARMILEPKFGPRIVQYLEQVGSGESIKAGDPAFSVRRRLFGAKKTRAVSLEAVLRGAVAFHEGRQLSRVEINNRFPAIVG
jgi:hypothetical protein